jgi:outer membrane murein-binding lipoprotein Lpp
MVTMMVSAAVLISVYINGKKKKEKKNRLTLGQAASFQSA